MTPTTASLTPRRATAALAGFVLAIAVTVLADPAPAAAAAPAPTPTPARVGKPTTMAALGDSITQATGTGELSKENPKNSWSTGWEVDSVAEQLGISDANRQNLSANGARMGDADSQVLTGRDGAALKSTTQYVTIELGGNDLCRDSVAEMTSVATYRTQLSEALAAIESRAPEALVFVMSVPDIYNLWYIRGAPQNSTYHPEAESDQADGLNGARFYWGQSFFPCQSLLSNPDSYAQADRDRRAAVRQRTLDYNAALEAECAEWLRCRYDDDQLFDMTSNRVSPPNGALLPQSEWAFTDSDISRNEGAGKYLCPVQGVVAGGCGDHFHPSKAGQVKLADSAMASSYQFSDTTAPSVGLTASPAPRSDGTYKGPVTVSFSGSDAAGLRGQEVRIHRPDGTVTEWDQSIGVHPAITVSELGTTYVEVRSLDVNGNQSASKILTLNLTTTVPGAVGAPQVASGAGWSALAWSPVADDGGTAITAYDVEQSDVTGGAATVTRGGTSLERALTATNGQVARYRVRAVNSVGTGAWSPAVTTLAPFDSVSDFVAQGYTTLAQRAPTTDESRTATDALTAGTLLPATQTASLIEGDGWEPVISPIVRLYRAYFLRDPEAGGLEYWEGRRRSGLSIHAMSQLFSGTAEFRTMYGSLSNREFVRRVYLNVLEREPEQAGWDYWTAELDEGRMNRGRMMIGYSESAEYRTASSTLVRPIVVWWGLLDRLPRADEATAAAATLADDGTTADLVSTVYATTEWATHVE